MSEGASDPTIISSTCQEFLGVRYYLCGRYFQRQAARLHRVVWQHSHGPVPPGKHVHHENHDRGDNRLANLVLLEGAQHVSHHSRSQTQVPGAKAHEAAAAWHRSEEGRAWHRQNGLTSAAKRVDKFVQLTCECCGAPFMALSYVAARARFCHANCKMRMRRQRV